MAFAFRRTAGQTDTCVLLPIPLRKGYHTRTYAHAVVVVASPNCRENHLSRCFQKKSLAALKEAREGSLCCHHEVVDVYISRCGSFEPSSSFVCSISAQGEKLRAPTELSCSAKVLRIFSMRRPSHTDAVTPLS